MRAHDLPTVDIRPVGAFEIHDDKLAIFHKNSTVAFGYVAFGQDDVIAFNTANPYLGLVKVEGRLLAVLLTDRDCEHAARLLDNCLVPDDRCVWISGVGFVSVGETTQDTPADPLLSELKGVVG